MAAIMTNSLSLGYEVVQGCLHPPQYVPSKYGDVWDRNFLDHALQSSEVEE